VKLLDSIRFRMAALFRRSQIDADMDDELRSHIQLRADDLEDEGASRAEAERKARIEFGAYERFKEECHEEAGGTFFESLKSDVRLAVRMLRKSPGFALVAVITLAVAIGANALVFGVLNALILRPLNVPRPESLYGLEHGASGYESYPNYLDIRERNRSFEDLGAFTIADVALDTGTGPSRVWSYEITGNYFDVLGLQPHLGRLIHASDEHGLNSAPYAVLSHSFWHSHFQDNPDVVGRTVLLNKHPYTVVGVAPPKFFGTLAFFTPDLFVPIVNQQQITGEDSLNVRTRDSVFEVVGHLRPGTTVAQAEADLNSIGAYLEKSYPNQESHAAFRIVRPALYGNFIGAAVLAFVSGLMLLAGLILLASCANLGSLFAARASDRAREVALRLALGSSRMRILRQLLTEAMLISVAGGVVGLVASIVLLDKLSEWQPFSRFPLHIPVSPDGKVYVVAVSLALISGVLFGIVPVRQVFEANPYEVVKAGPTGRTGRRVSVRDVLLVVQIAICAVLVTSSMVAVRGLLRSMHSNFGIDPQNAMLAEAALPMAGYTDDKVPAMQRRIFDAMNAIPGVEAAAIADLPPLNMDGRIGTVFADDTTDFRPANVAANPYTFSVTPGYFEAAGTVLQSGRTFNWHDDENAPRVAVVNREFARRLFGADTNPVGRHFKLRDGVRIEVVGLVEDGKYLSLTENQKSAMFFPIQQAPSKGCWVVLRSKRDPEELTLAMTNTLRNLDAGLPFTIMTWRKEIDAVLFPMRMATVSLGILGVMGALLSVTGIFGMAAYSVSKRVREFGIRIALGAQRREVIKPALGRAFRLLAMGSVIGLVLGLLAARVLAAIVYQASPRDPIVLIAAVVAMALLGLVATWIPAQRALSVDPLVLLREE
jgi:predicted permease